MRAHLGSRFKSRKAAASAQQLGECVEECCGLGRTALCVGQGVKLKTMSTHRDAPRQFLHALELVYASAR